MSTAKKREGNVATRPSDSKGTPAVRLDNVSLQKMFVEQISNALWLPTDLSNDEMLARMATAVAAVESLKPEGTEEKMLAVQIVANPNAALDCLRKAALPGQSPHVWEMSLKLADRLMKTYLQQMETLARLRGKGPANILGNFMNVQPGGQAVVQMNTAVPAERSAAEADGSALALEHHPVDLLNLERSSDCAVADRDLTPSPEPVSQDERSQRTPARAPSDRRRVRRV
jgi:hypothetical protein